MGVWDISSYVCTYCSLFCTSTARDENKEGSGAAETSEIGAKTRDHEKPQTQTNACALRPPRAVLLYDDKQQLFTGILKVEVPTLLRMEDLFFASTPDLCMGILEPERCASPFPIGEDGRTQQPALHVFVKGSAGKCKKCEPSGAMTIDNRQPSSQFMKKKIYPPTFSLSPLNTDPSEWKVLPCALANPQKL